MLGRSRPISWLKPARKEFEGFPEGARERMLQALDIAAAGSMAAIAKPLKGFGSGVFEVALKFRTDAFRVVYAVSAAMRFRAFSDEVDTGSSWKMRQNQ